ncbi:MAG: hypothetical protein GIX03_06980 [Candidatus Eremiobacteraeota bacterium]|nr:hypothetical protein [Candidatus Eremiobacteraeota bacterium]
MMGPRAGLSSVLVLGAIVLLVAIAVGNGMGNRVLGQVAGRASDVATTPLPLTTASPDAAGNPKSFSWKRRQVLSVATDPAFPDPRITPEPTPEPTARPTAPPTARPTPTPPPTPRVTASPRRSTYTTPPLLFPMGTHSPALEPSPAGSGLASPSPTPTRSLPSTRP